MAKNIGVCGLDCSKCACYRATVSDDNDLRIKTAAKWAVEFHHPDLKPEDIECNGCTSEGPWFEHCLECEYRLCAMDKGIENCGRCEDYPCKQISKFQEAVPGTAENCSTSA